MKDDEIRNMTEIFAMVMLLWRSMHGDKSVIEQMTPRWGLQYPDIRIEANCSSTNWTDDKGYTIPPYSALITDTKTYIPICIVNPFEGQILGLIMNEERIVDRLEEKVREMIDTEKEYKCEKCRHVAKSITPLMRCPKCGHGILIISINTDNPDYYIQTLNCKQQDKPI